MADAERQINTPSSPSPTEHIGLLNEKDALLRRHCFSLEEILLPERPFFDKDGLRFNKRHYHGIARLSCVYHRTDD
jgi:hypothetical protein